MPECYRTWTACRVCGGPFDALLDLGTPVLSTFLRPEDPDPPRAPLELVVCQRCDLVQLRHSVENDRLYRHYWYQSGINESMQAELTDVALRTLQAIGGGRKGDVLLDVGANDGTLLTILRECYQDAPSTCRLLAVEPSTTFHDRLQQIADCTIADYFPSAKTRAIPSQSLRAIFSIAMFYDLDDPRSFVAEVDRLLTPDGVWVVQMQDLAQMVWATGYDNCCQEHRCYYSTATFNQLLADFDLAVVDIKTRTINGGSLRYLIRRRTYAQDQTALVGQLDQESWLTRDRLDRFVWQVAEHKASLLGTLDQLRGKGLAVDLYAASTKSSTLLQYCGLDASWIRCAVERSPEKVGLVTSGTRIPIIAEADWRVSPAPATLLGAWGFRDAFLRREADYLRRGGSFIIPLPRLEVVYGA